MVDRDQSPEEMQMIYLARQQAMPMAPMDLPLVDTLSPASTGSGNFEKLNRFFAAIYDGPNETPPWNSALQLLRGVLGAKHVTLILRPPSNHSNGVMINTDTVALDATESYQSHFFAIDPFVGLPEGQIVTPEELVGEQWADSTLYREYLRPLDVAHLIGADVHTSDGIECRFRVSRARDTAPFTAQEKALCRFLLPHLRRAIQLHTRLEGLENQRELFAGVVNRLQLGMISFAHDGRVLGLNPEARRILGEKDGIRYSSDTLCLDSRQEGRELQRILRSTLEKPGIAEQPGLAEAMSITRPSGRSKLGVVIRRIPFAPWTEGLQKPAAVMFVRDPEAGGAQASQEIVQQLFGLTRMEAALALHLAEGYTLEEAAERLGVKKNTARTYLRFIFCKTGVTRQTMLIRKLLNSVAPLG